MTRESSLWTCFRDALPSDAHKVRVENGVEVGTPDVNLCIAPRQALLTAQDVWEYGEPCSMGAEGEQFREASSGWDGWVELKVQDPPVRVGTMFRIDHFTTEQRQWLADRTRAGGLAYTLVQIGKSRWTRSKYLWIRGDIAAVWIDHCTLTDLLLKCDWHGESLNKLVEYLQR